MFGLSRYRRRWSTPWVIAGLVAAAILFALLLLVNIAAQAYERHQFLWHTFNITTPWFPERFLGGSLKDKAGCVPLLLREGDLLRTNHSLFEYKVIDAGGEIIQYSDTPLTNCFVEEILVQATKTLVETLPQEFGFFPIAECLVVCQSPSIKLSATYRYANTDPLRQAQADVSSPGNMVRNPLTYWPQALLTYWWDELAINLTQANEDSFGLSLQTVLLQGTPNVNSSEIALYPNNTNTNIDTSSSITTSFMLTNSSQPAVFTRPPQTDFTSEHLLFLRALQIENASAQFFDTLFWAVNLDLGQFSPRNIFTDPPLLADATDVFHNNAFINDTYQDTPQSDNEIPGTGYRELQGESAPLTQTPAYFQGTYQCWKWVGKPFLAALIDVLVPSIVILSVISATVYYLSRIRVGRRGNVPSQDFVLVPTQRLPSVRNNTDYQDLDPENRYLIPQNRFDTADHQTPSDHGQSIEEQHPVLENPFEDPPATQAEPEVRTLESDPSILETPVNVFEAQERDGYRVSLETARVFEAHARRMEMENVRPPEWTRPLSQRRSSTDLKRMRAVK